MWSFLWQKHFNIVSLGIGILMGILIFWAPGVGAISVTTPELPIQPGEVNTTMILDGTIVNADISAAAAILATKVASSSGYEFLTSSSQQIAGVKTFTSLPIVPAGTPSGNQVVSASYLGSIPSTPSLSLTAGVYLATGTAVYVEYGNQTSTAWDNGAIDSANDPCAFGYHTGIANQCATKLHLSVNTVLSALKVNVKKIGNGQPLAFLLVNDSAGLPGNTIYASTTLLQPTSLTTNYTVTSTAFTAPYTVTSTNDYWLVASTTQPGDPSNFLRTPSAYFCTPNYAGAQSDPLNAWSALTRCLDITVIINDSAGYVYKASAANASSGAAFLGFTTGAAEGSATTTIAVAGGATPALATGTLPIGYQIYLTDRFGFVSSTPGTVSRKVGISYSATQLLITNIW